MTLYPEGQLIVSEIAGKRAIVKYFGVCPEAASLPTLGFEAQDGEYVRPIADHLDRQTLVRELINLSALFIGGPDLSPAELVRYYRDSNSIEGAFLEVVWRSPRRYEVSES